MVRRIVLLKQNKKSTRYTMVQKTVYIQQADGLLSINPKALLSHTRTVNLI